MKLILPLFLFLVASSHGQADEKDLAAKLEGRGLEVRKNKDGGVIEIRASSTTAMAREDYQSFAKFPLLHKLYLTPRELRVNDDTLTAMGALPGVDSFFAGSAQFTDEGLKGFAGWTGLKYFGLDHWFGPPNSKANVGKGLSYLAGLPQLEAVRLGGCRVDDEAPMALAKCKTLVKVDLFHTSAVTDAGVKALQALPKLKIIVLGPQFTPRITDRSLEYLSQIPTLEEISIVGTWLTYADGFTHLHKLPNLKLLSLKDVLADEKDIARLKAEMPALKVEWNLPDAPNTEKLHKTFKK